jgi:hypothetical protein
MAALYRIAIMIQVTGLLLSTNLLGRPFSDSNHGGQYHLGEFPEL